MPYCVPSGEGTYVESPLALRYARFVPATARVAAVTLPLELTSCTPILPVTPTSPANVAYPFALNVPPMLTLVGSRGFVSCPVVTLAAFRAPT